MAAPLIPVILAGLRHVAAGAAMRLGSAAATVGRTVRASGAALQKSPTARGLANRAKAAITGEGGRAEAASATMPANITNVFRQVMGNKGSTVSKITQNVSALLSTPRPTAAQRNQAAAARLDPKEMPRFSDPIMQAGFDDANDQAKAATAEAEFTERMHGMAKTLAIVGGGGYVAKKLFDFGTFLYGTVDKVRAWATSVVDSRRTLAKWNGSISAAFQHLDMARMSRAMRTAQNTAGSTRFAIEGVSQMEEALRPLKEFSMSLQNIGAGVGGRAISTLISGINQLRILGFRIGQAVDLANKWMNQGQKEFDMHILNKMLQDIANGKAKDFPVRRELPPLNPPRVR